MVSQTLAENHPRITNRIVLLFLIFANLHPVDLLLVHVLLQT